MGAGTEPANLSRVADRTTARFTNDPFLVRLGRVSESPCHLVVLLGLITAAIGPAVLLSQPVQRTPCLARFNRVQMEMTRSEVTAKLGAPPVNVTVRDDESFGVRSWEEWVGPDGDCVVGFGSDGRVHYCRVSPRLPKKSLWERVRYRPPRCPGTLRALPKL